jgi:hypothetical protein
LRIVVEGIVGWFIIPVTIEVVVARAILLFSENVYTLPFRVFLDFNKCISAGAVGREIGPIVIQHESEVLVQLL